MAATQITAGSYSRIVVFETCPQQAKLAYLEKIPEPPRPLPPGKTEHANDRGTRIHEAAEKFVQGGVELIPELEKFRPELERLRVLYAAKQCSLEGEWAFTRDWKPTAWRSSNVWLRVKLDAIVFQSATKATVIDYKSGKRWGNEIKHGEQMQLYQLATFLRYPKIMDLVVELWYSDLDELISTKYRRDQGLRFLAGFEARMARMLNETEFAPRPSPHACKYCPYRAEAKGGTGHCKSGV